MKITTKNLVQTALLLTICMASQYFKNLSVYITGPIVNATIMIAVLSVSLGSGILISIVTPITAFFFTGSPILAAIPLMFPVIMAGNSILAVSVWLFENKLHFKGNLAAGFIIGSVLKSAFMGIISIFMILPLFGHNIAALLPQPDTLPLLLNTARITYSVTQLITSLTGSLLAYALWLPLKSYLKTDTKK